MGSQLTQWELLAKKAILYNKEIPCTLELDKDYYKRYKNHEKYNLLYDTICNGGYKHDYYRRPYGKIEGTREQNNKSYTDFADITNKSIDDFVKRGIYKRIRGNEVGCINPLGSAPKSDGSRRPVIDTSTWMTRYVRQDKFPQLPLWEYVIRNIQQDDLMISLDLKDGYYHIPIDEDSNKYLSFKDSRGYLYKITKLAMGANYAPWLFQLFMEEIRDVIKKKLKRFGIEREHFAYIDDWFWYGNISEILIQTVIIVKELNKRKWKINMDKSSIYPEKQKKLLGRVIDTRRMIYYNHPDNVMKLVKKLNFLKDLKYLTKRRLYSICSSFQWHIGENRYMRAIIRELYKIGKRYKTKDWNERLNLTKIPHWIKSIENLKRALKTIVTPIYYTKNRIEQIDKRRSRYEIYTDASNKEGNDFIGYYIIDKDTKDRLRGSIEIDKNEKRTIVQKEFMALLMTLDNFKRLFENKIIEIFIDSRIVRDILLKGSASTYVLNEMSKYFWRYMFENNILPIINWIETDKNKADYYSRNYIPSNLNLGSPGRDSEARAAVGDDGGHPHKEVAF